MAGDEGHGWLSKAAIGAGVTGVIGLGFFIAQGVISRESIPAASYELSLKVTSSNCTDSVAPGQFITPILTFSETEGFDGTLVHGDQVQITRGDGADMGTHELALPRFEFSTVVADGTREHWIIVWESDRSSRARLEYFGPAGCVLEAEEQGGI